MDVLYQGGSDSEDEEVLAIRVMPRLEMERRHPFALFEFNDKKVRQLLRLSMREISALAELLGDALEKMDFHRPIAPINRVGLLCSYFGMCY
jgi:hypothetical protein